MTLELVLLLALVLIAQGAQMADEDGLCLKMEELGNREGNTYYCTDPDLQLCCQTDDTFKCCESEEEKTLNDQIMLWGFVFLTILAVAVLIVLVTTQGDIWESETIKLAAYNLGSKLGITALVRKVKSTKGASNDDSKGSGTQSTHAELQRMPLSWF